MGKKRFLAVALCAAAVMGVGANAALAGEVKGHGNGETPMRGRAAHRSTRKLGVLVLGTE